MHNTQLAPAAQSSIEIVATILVSSSSPWWQSEKPRLDGDDDSYPQAFRSHPQTRLSDRLADRRRDISHRSRTRTARMDQVEVSSDVVLARGDSTDSIRFQTIQCLLPVIPPVVATRTARTTSTGPTTHVTPPSSVHIHIDLHPTNTIRPLSN